MKKLLLLFMLATMGTVFAQTNLGPVKIGGGTTIANSSNVAQTNQQNTFTQAQTIQAALSAQILNGTFNVARYSGGDVCAKVQACITGLGNTRGTCDATELAPVWPATAACSGFSAPPGVTVIFGNGTYVQSGTITSQAGSRIIGNLGHTNGQGTVLKAGDTFAGNQIELKNPISDWWHWGLISGFEIDGNKTVRATHGITTGYGIAGIDPFGEASSVEFIQVQNEPQDGINVHGVGQASSYMHRVSAFSNGRYGINYDDVGGSNTCDNCSGDDNTLALVHALGEQSASVVFINLKGETKSTGLQPDMVLLEGTNGTPAFTFIGGTANVVASSTTNYIHVINGAVNIHMQDEWLDFVDITNVIKDDVRGITVPMSLYNTFSASGHIVDLKHYGSSPTYFTGGSNPALLFANGTPISWLDISGTVLDILKVTTGNITNLRGAGNGINFLNAAGAVMASIVNSTLSLFPTDSTGKSLVLKKFDATEGGEMVWEGNANDYHVDNNGGSWRLMRHGGNGGTFQANALSVNASNVTTVYGTLNIGFLTGSNITQFQLKQGAIGGSTGAAVGSTFTTASITLSPAFADANYSAQCLLNSPTGVPTISSITKTDASHFTITIAALTAVAATGNYDCTIWHQ